MTLLESVYFMSGGGRGDNDSGPGRGMMLAGEHIKRKVNSGKHGRFPPGFFLNSEFRGYVRDCIEC